MLPLDEEVLAFQEPDERIRLPISARRVHILNKGSNKITNSSIIIVCQVYGLACVLERFAQVPSPPRDTFRSVRLQDNLQELVCKVSDKDIEVPHHLDEELSVETRLKAAEILMGGRERVPCHKERC